MDDSSNPLEGPNDFTAFARRLKALGADIDPAAWNTAHEILDAIIGRLEHMADNGPLIRKGED